MNIKPFEEYLKDGTAKKQTPNKSRALALISEVEKRKINLEDDIKMRTTERIYPNSVIETCYDIIMELIRAKMFFDGYNSGNSHQAEVSYLKILAFENIDISLLDELKYYRNGIKYYGTILTKEYSDKTLLFMNTVYYKLKKLLSNIK